MGTAISLWSETSRANEGLFGRTPSTFRDAQMLHLNEETARPEQHLWDAFGKGRGYIISLA